MKKYKMSLMSRNKKWQFIPLIILGVLIFGQTSGLELNPFVKSYLLVMEINITLLCVFFLSKHKSDRQKNINF